MESKPADGMRGTVDSPSSRTEEAGNKGEEHAVAAPYLAALAAPVQAATAGTG